MSGGLLSRTAPGRSGQERRTTQPSFDSLGSSSTHRMPGLPASSSAAAVAVTASNTCRTAVARARSLTAAARTPAHQELTLADRADDLRWPVGRVLALGRPLPGRQPVGQFPVGGVVLPPPRQETAVDRAPDPCLPLALGIGLPEPGRLLLREPSVDRVAHRLVASRRRRHPVHKGLDGDVEPGTGQVAHERPPPPPRQCPGVRPVQVGRRLDDLGHVRVAGGGPLGDLGRRRGWVHRPPGHAVPQHFPDAARAPVRTVGEPVDGDRGDSGRVGGRRHLRGHVLIMAETQLRQKVSITSLRNFPKGSTSSRSRTNADQCSNRSVGTTSCSFPQCGRTSRAPAPPRSAPAPAAPRRRPASR